MSMMLFIVFISALVTIKTVIKDIRIMIVALPLRNQYEINDRTMMAIFSITDRMRLERQLVYHFVTSSFPRSVSAAVFPDIMVFVIRLDINHAAGTATKGIETGANGNMAIL
jgi:hypothetical protein